jgi:hypothetical protein
MVVYYLDIVRIAAVPAKTDAPLLIDADAVPASPVALKRFQPVAGRHAQLVQGSRGVEYPELAQSRPMHLRRQMPRPDAMEQPFGVFASERPDHVWIITRGDNNVKRYDSVAIRRRVA